MYKYSLFISKVKFRVADQTLYQWGIIEPENDYIEIKVSDDPERFIAIAREIFYSLKYYLMMSSGIKMSVITTYLVMELSL